MTSPDTNAATPTSYQSIHEVANGEDARGQAQGTTVRQLSTSSRTATLLERMHGRNKSTRPRTVSQMSLMASICLPLSTQLTDS